MFSNTQQKSLLTFSTHEPKAKGLSIGLYVLGGPIKFTPLCGYRPKKKKEGNESLYYREKKN